jgi:hypothetical protein
LPAYRFLPVTSPPAFYQPPPPVSGFYHSPPDLPRLPWLAPYTRSLVCEPTPLRPEKKLVGPNRFALPPNCLVVTRGRCDSGSRNSTQPRCNRRPRRGRGRPCSRV